MNKDKFKNLFYPTIVLLLICLFSSFLLALTNQVSLPLIEQIKIDNENKAKKTIVSEANEFSDVMSLNYNGQDYQYYEAYNENNEKIAYIFTTSGKGYGGDVVVMSGIDMNGNITGINFLQLNETAGLGMRANSPDFMKQFTGLNADSGFTLVKSKAGDNEVQALTGATITSNAVSDACKTAFELYKSLEGGK